jgi:hypothetical protein
MVSAAVHESEAGTKETLDARAAFRSASGGHSDRLVYFLLGLIFRRQGIAAAATLPDGAFIGIWRREFSLRDTICYKLRSETAYFSRGPSCGVKS